MSKYEKRGLCENCERPLKAMISSKYCYTCIQREKDE